MSGFQIHFASKEIFTPGDQVDAMVAMNPAALTTNLVDLVSGGILVVNKDAFDEKGLKQAGYEENPLEDGSLAAYQVFPVEVTRLTRLAVEELGLGVKEADRCRNFYSMGLVFWLYDRSLDPTLRYIEAKFGKRPEIAEANRRASRQATTTAKPPRPSPASSASTKPSCRRGCIATSWGMKPRPTA